MRQEKRKPVVHELKTEPAYFKDVKSSKKTFEVRINDRDFQVGDTLLLKEYVLGGFFGDSWYTGCTLRRVVTYILRDSSLLLPGFCIMSITPVKKRRKTCGQAPAKNDRLGGSRARRANSVPA